MITRLTISLIQHQLERAADLPRIPDPKEFPVYRDTDVIDEDQTVRWNREEVARRNQLRSDKLHRLLDTKKEAYKKASELGVRYIVQETSLNDDQAKILWDHIFNNYRNSIDNLIVKLYDLIELYNKIDNAK